MMLMDSKGKVFGKVSIVDILVVVALIVVAAGVFVRFQGAAGKAISKETTFHYSMVLREFRTPTKLALEQSIGKDFFLNEKKQSDMGKLLRAEFVPAKKPLEKADGTTIDATVPDRFDVVLTFEIKGKENDTGYYSNQLQEITAGTNHVIKSKGVTCFGTILKVW